MESDSPTGIAPNSANAATAPEGKSDLSAEFQVPLDADNVELFDLLFADVLRTPELTEDDAHREIGESYYPKLNAAYRRKYPDAEMVVSSMAGMGLALGAGEPDEFEIVVNRAAVTSINWTKPARLIVKINEVAEDVRRWIPDQKERYGLLTMLLGIASHLLGTVASTNKSALENRQTDPSGPSPTLPADETELIESQIDTVRQQFLEDAQRAAQLRYARGMAWGAVGLLILSAVGGVVCLHWDIRVVNGIGLLAGGVGACVSVLQRMTSGTLVLNYKTVDRMLMAFGALRPFVGGVFGLVTFCVLDANLISAIHLPSGLDQRLSLVVVFAFAAGFNERFFQDMLGKASGADEPSTQDPDNKASQARGS